MFVCAAGVNLIFCVANVTQHLDFIEELFVRFDPKHDGCPAPVLSQDHRLIRNTDLIDEPRSSRAKNTYRAGTRRVVSLCCSVLCDLYVR